MLRLDAAAFGAPRAAVLKALAAEGIPCSAGYGFSLPRPAAVPQQGVRAVPAERLRHGSTTATRAARTAISSAASSASGSGRTCCSDPREDMDDIARAFEKVYAHRDALTGRRVMP